MFRISYEKLLFLIIRLLKIIDYNKKVIFMYIAKFNLNAFKNTPIGTELKKLTNYRWPAKYAAECRFTISIVVVI